MAILNDLRARAGVRALLSRPDANPKVAKNQKIGVYTTVLHLAPGDMSGHEVCPKRSPGCSAACLHFAGSPLHLKGKTKARVARTKLFFADRDLFMNILALELAAHLRAAKRRGMTPGARLNGTSDIVWERKHFRLYPEVEATLDRMGTSIIELFPEITFYDYTKIPGRTPPSHYHLTFSEAEDNALDVAREMARGRNIASVFSDRLPLEHLGRTVVDGDEHDFRPADGVRIVVGLKVKGLLGKVDRTGFVQTGLDTLIAA